MATLAEARREAVVLCTREIGNYSNVISVLSLYSQQQDTSPNELNEFLKDEVEFLAKILLALIDVSRSVRSFAYAQERYEYESGVRDSLDKGGHTGYGRDNDYSQNVVSAQEELKKSDTKLKELYCGFLKVLQARLAVKT